MRLGKSHLAVSVLTFALLVLAISCGSDKSSEPGPDVTAPAAVADLGAQTACNDVTLTWTAPGDDGTTGRAASYDVRYSTVTITDGNWGAATQCTGEPAPKTAGQAEAFIVQNLATATTYHFALKTSDSDGNESGLSNVPNTLTGTPSFLVWINDGLGEDEDWTNSATSLSAKWSGAACVESYWYGIGTTAGITDVVDWTSAGAETSVTHTGLALTDGVKYYFVAHARIGQISGNPVVSDGITVDLTAPASQVAELPAEEPTAVFTVSWSGSDATSGIASYDVQVSSDGGGSWGTWLSATALTSDSFTGLNGHTYHFRSRARDNAGNVEAYPETPDTYATVNVAAGLVIAYVYDGLAADATWSASPDTLSANWAAASGATGYDYAIGTSAGGTDVVGWTSAGSATSITRAALSLVSGTTYFFSVRATVGATHGSPTSSNGATVDTGRPTSVVTTLPAATSTALFDVSWAGTDAVSGIATYDVQVRDGSGSWQDWFVGTVLTTAGYPGVADHTYAFRSRASDIAGNVEAYPVDPDASITVTCTYAYDSEWGSQGSADGQFDKPYGLTTDQYGNFYVSETLPGNRVQKFSPAGDFLLDVGLGGGGMSDGYFELPCGMAVDDSDYIYVVDTFHYRVQVFTSAGAFHRKWGTHGTGEGEFAEPRGIAIDGSGYVYVSDTGNNRIQKFDRNGGFILEWGHEGTGDGEFKGPYGLAIGLDGALYVSEIYGHRVQVFTPQGQFITRWGSYGTADGQFVNPEFVAIDPAGHVVIGDYNNDRIQRFTADGTFLNKWGGAGSDPGMLSKPYGVAFDAAGNIYVSDSGNYRIQKFAAMCP